MSKLIGMILLIPCLAAAYPEIGDSIFLKTWFSQTSFVDGDGLPGVGVLNTVGLGELGGTDYIFSVNPTGSDAAMWKPYIPVEGISVDIFVTEKEMISSLIKTCSAKFENCTWISGIYSSFQFIGDKVFYFPILPSGIEYEDADSFLVRLSDTVGVFCSYSSESAAFKSRFIVYSGAHDETGQELDIQVEPLSLYTGDNVFRFGGIVAHSRIAPYIGMDLMCCGEGYYGMTVTDYKSNPLSAKVPNRIHKSQFVFFGQSRSYDISGRSIPDRVRSTNMIVEKGIHQTNLMIYK